ncbi:MAG: N-acetyltransferase [Cocleimonas sp.]|nr:N-acetyltransferase [Cocleimonas sp.]
MIRNATADDADIICNIYNDYIENTVISFEEAPLSVTEMKQLINRVLDQYLWLVFEKDQQVLGYAYANQWKERSAYRYTLETTIYLAPQAIGQGIGTQLYAALIKQLNHKGIHNIVACIALPNIQSVALHEKLGFKKVAHFEAVGRKFNQWIDVGFWQRKGS